MNAVPAESARLLADLQTLAGFDSQGREPAFERLEAALGSDFADRLVAALASHPVDPRRR